VCDWSLRVCCCSNSPSNPSFGFGSSVRDASLHQYLSPEHAKAMSGNNSQGPVYKVYVSVQTAATALCWSGSTGSIHYMSGTLCVSCATSVHQNNALHAQYSTQPCLPFLHAYIVLWQISQTVLFCRHMMCIAAVLHGPAARVHSSLPRHHDLWHSTAAAQAREEWSARPRYVQQASQHHTHVLICICLHTPGAGTGPVIRV
jgi:hypothetical protein